MEAYLTPEGFCGILLGLICLGVIALRATSTSTFEFVDWSLLFMGLVFGISAPLVVDAIRQDPQRFVGSEFLVSYGGAFAQHTLAAVIAIMGLLIGWRCAGWSRSERSQHRKGVFSGLDNPILFRRAFWVMLVLAVLGQYLYTLDYGGLLGVVDYSKMIRSGLLGIEEQSSFSFLKPVAGFSLLAAYGFLGLLMVSSSRTLLTWIGFVTSSVFAIYVLYTWLGRLSMATFFAVLLLAFWLIRSPKRISVTFGFFVAAGLGMALVYQISGLLERGSSETVLQFYLEEISFIFTGFWAEVSNPSLSFRYFYDILVTPMFLLPSSWTQGSFQDVGDVHTEVMLGAAKGEGGVTGAMPIDLLTMGFMQMHVAGVFIYALLFGMVLRALQAVANSIELPGVRAAFSAYIALEIAGYALFYSHPGHIVRSNFALIAVLLLVLVVRRLAGSGLRNGIDRSGRSRDESLFLIRT